VYAKRQAEEAPNMTSQVTTIPLLRSNFQYVSKSLQVFVCQMFLTHSFLFRHFTHFDDDDDRTANYENRFELTHRNLQLQYIVNMGLLLRLCMRISLTFFFFGIIPCR